MAGFSGHWAFAFGLLGNIVSFMVFLAPIPTFYRIYKKKSSEGYQSIPYVVALFSAVLWIYYAFLKCNATLLITINSVGIFIQTFYIFFHFFYASRNAKVQSLKLLLVFIVSGIGIVSVTQAFVKPSERVIVIGWICLVFSLCVFVAPLCILRQVVRTKSVEHMPFLLSVFLTISAVMWFFYGLFLKDYNIALPNVLGFIFGVLQMVLYARYKSEDKMIEKKLPETQVQQIIVVDQNPPELINEHIIEIVKISALLSADKIPVSSEANLHDSLAVV
ncbi:hypothetical protein ACS0TY_031114 [Phlomoides rotata]